MKQLEKSDNSEMLSYHECERVVVDVLQVGEQLLSGVLVQSLCENLSCPFLQVSEAPKQLSADEGQSMRWLEVVASMTMISS